MSTDFRRLVYLVRSDLYRYYGRTSSALLLRELVFGLGFRYTFWMRVTNYLADRVMLKPLYWMTRLILRRCLFKFGIQIPFSTEIGPGLCIGHFGSIIVNGRTRIGRNCNICQDVTLGESSRGKTAGNPTIGDNVYIGPGAKVFGRITIGNNVAIGANAVVTKDVPDNAVVVGIPAKIISYEGAIGYVSNTEYDGDGG